MGRWCATHRSGWSRSDALRPLMEHSKASPTVGARPQCGFTAQCLPLENKVADTNWPTELSARLQEHWKDLQKVLGAGGTSTVFLWWKFKIILKEERRVRYYPKTTPQGSSLSSVTKGGSEERIRLNCDNSKTSHFLCLKIIFCSSNTTCSSIIPYIKP